MSPSPLGKALPHESGLKHATGEALYVDDYPEPPGLLHGWPVLSPHAHARILSRSGEAARSVPGVHAVYFASDIPGLNDVSPVGHGEPLLAEEAVHTVGQLVALVVAETPEAARQGAEAVEVDYAPQPAILSIEEAIRAESFHTPPYVIARGDVDAALQAAALRFSGEVSTGAQDHFYLETQAALALPLEGGHLHVLSSTQHPSEVQATVAEVLGLGRHRVVVECPRMGGGFGGKESQAAAPAALAALAARSLGRPVKIRYTREVDMCATGKRHPWWSRFEAGFDGEGRLLALKVWTYSDGGWAIDLSKAVLQRCLFHLDNAYYVPACRFEGRVCRTNHVSQTAFRGFGGPQGMVVIEEILNRAAERLNLDPAEVRARNYYGEDRGLETPYGQRVEHNRMPRIHSELLERSEYGRRRGAIEAFNAKNAWVKRGIALAPVKFGISFTTAFLNQAGAYVLVYADGTVQLNHGGTEMGQGLHTKMLAICAHELGIPPERIRMMNTATDKVPNTSATAASSGSDLNGQAVRDACTKLRTRLAQVAAGMLECPPETVVFEDGEVFTTAGEARCTFEAVCDRAHLSQVPLAATGYYRTPDIHFDEATGRGKPFHYFAFGAAVVEVEVSGLTGEYRLRRVDILHDVGDSLVPSIDRGQIEGGFVQGVGWLTTEEWLWREDGTPLTLGPSTYKIPAMGDAPEAFHVALLEDARNENTIHGSKAVGEPPLMLAIGVLTALRHALGAFAPRPGLEVPLAIPATPEAVLRAVEAVRRA